MATTIIIPENASLAEYKALLADARAQGADIKIILEIFDKIAAKEDRLALIAATEGFKPTRATLFVRRVDEKEIEELVPDVDVFDDIELQDIIRKATDQKRAYTDEDKLATYKDLKAKGFTDITYDKVNESVVGTAPVVDIIVNEDPNVVEEADTDADETDEPEDTDTAEA
jgi:hypothetical protein